MLSCASDVNGDGISDLVVFGLTHQPLNSCYSVWIYPGSPSSLLVPPFFGRGMLPINLPTEPLWFADVDDDNNVDIVIGSKIVRVSPIFGVDGIQSAVFPTT